MRQKKNNQIKRDRREQEMMLLFLFIYCVYLLALYWKVLTSTEKREENYSKSVDWINQRFCSSFKIHAFNPSWACFIASTTSLEQSKEARKPKSPEKSSCKQIRNSLHLLQSTADETKKPKWRDKADPSPKRFGLKAEGKKKKKIRHTTTKMEEEPTVRTERGMKKEHNAYSKTHILGHWNISSFRVTQKCKTRNEENDRRRQASCQEQEDRRI